MATQQTTQYIYTMAKKVIYTDEAPEPIGPYSQAIAVNGMLFVSGQVAIDAFSGVVVRDSIEAETKQVMQNIGHILQANDMDYSHIVKTTIFLKDMHDFPKMNEVYGSYFSNQPPARETVEVSCLPKNVSVEISCIAIK